MRLPDGVESIRAFGRRVKRSHPTILQAIEEGRIQSVYRRPGGRIAGVYWALALHEYQNNTDPVQAARGGAEPLAVAPAIEWVDTGTGGKPQSPPDPADDMFDAGEPVAETARTGKDDPHGYLEHRAKTEEFRAKKAEIEYLRDLGLVESVEEAREADFRLFRTLRDKLINIPDRVATVLAAEREPTRVHQQLTEEIKRVLSELSSFAGAEAADGVAQRMEA